MSEHDDATELEQEITEAMGADDLDGEPEPEPETDAEPEPTEPEPEPEPQGAAAQMAKMDAYATRVKKYLARNMDDS